MNPFAKEAHLKEAEKYIRSYLSEIPGTAVVLGSGLGYFADTLESSVVLNNQDIPHFPRPTVAGHEGKMIFGKIDNTTLLAIQGRSHFYEGKSFAEITFYVQLLKRLGIKNLILTNAAGGMNPALKPGDLVLLNDFINFTQIDVLPSHQLSETFFSEHLSQIAKRTAQKAGLKLHEGSYCWTTGPSYETHAEVRIIHDLGADVVGMSTVPELIMGAHLGLNVLGISLVTNLAAGISATPLTHEEVQAVADEIKEPYANYMSNLIVAIVNSET
ncbi:purine-nucleoside phosphorylase [bacterium]|nr:purine-nucleoside phosphorylase [bacterium]MBU1064971.1 purine-nucleoside phosphorylase [bacterium]MBU1635005.1 purine-nucleoside phosphorylase [bacterium]MBU1872739.1 purine-nucleoside phosphorylase [bacterium]